MDQEFWKPIPGYEGHYEASNHGRIRSVSRLNVTSRLRVDGSPIVERRKSVMRSFRLNPAGYYLVNLSKDGVRKTLAVHVLICSTFHGERPSRMHNAAHNDGVPTNCRADNLRWATYKENLADRHAHGTAPTGENQYGAKLTWDKVREIRASKDAPKVLAERYGVFPGHIRKILRNEKWVENRKF